MMLSLLFLGVLPERNRRRDESSVIFVVAGGGCCFADFSSDGCCREICVQPHSGMLRLTEIISTVRAGSARVESYQKIL